MKAPPIGPIRTEIASALSNKAETFVTSFFFTTSPKKALHVVQCAISKIPKAKANGISEVSVKASFSARYPITHMSTAIIKSKVIINVFLENLSASTPPKGPVTTPTIATVNKIVDKALAFPVVSNIHTPIAKKDIEEPVQETVWPNQRR